MILCLILDLPNSYLKLKCKITKSNGTNIVAADEVALINHQSLHILVKWMFCKVEKNIKLITQLCIFLRIKRPYLNFGNDAKKKKKIQLGIGLFH